MIAGNKALRTIYDFITSHDNIGYMSYNAREFGCDVDACFVWDGTTGLWLLCADPQIVATSGSLETIEEVTDDSLPVLAQRWTSVVIEWFDIFNGSICIEQFHGPTAFALQYELAHAKI